MNRMKPTIIAVALFLLAGCATPAPTPTPGPRLATSPEDIVGTWRQINKPGPGWYFQFFEDGTLHGSENRELLEDHPWWKAEFRFEGTRLFMEGPAAPCDPNPTCIYEVHLLPNGNLKFVKIEDECAHRASLMQGRGDYEGLVEYEHVP